MRKSMLLKVLLLVWTLPSHTIVRSSDHFLAGWSDPNAISQSAQEVRQNRRFPPRDESDLDPSFARFRARLLTAVSRGDIVAIREAVAEKVRVPEGTLSAEEFLRQQTVQPGRRWGTLQYALELGTVATSDTEFVAPYLVAETTLDADMVVMGRNVALRDSPSPKARVVQRLDYHAVELLPDHRTDSRSRSIDDPATWAHVRTDAGDTGYVLLSLLRTRGEARFYFAKVDGNWKLVAYGYGD